MKRLIKYLPFFVLLFVGCSKAEEGGASDTSSGLEEREDVGVLF